MNTILTDDERLELAEPFGEFQYGDAQGDKRKDFARAVEAAVLAKLAQQEPFGWWHQGETEEESDFHLGDTGAGEGCAQCVPLYTHPTPQQTDHQRVPEGWKLVPVEPTERMCKAAADAWLDCHSKMVLNKAGAAAKAAIAAAPEAPAQQWVPTEERIPPDETPVLVLHNGQLRVLERRWDYPTHEKSYQAYWYWDDPNNDCEVIYEQEVTHWMETPSPPKV